MKILVVCQYYYPEPFRISDICEELVKRGHEVTVVTGLPNYPMGEIYDGYKNSEKRNEIINGVNVHRCFTIGRKQGVIYRFLNYYSYMFSSTRYVKKISDEYDVVFVNQLSPVMMGNAAVKYKKIHKTPFVLYCLDLWPASLTMGGISCNSILYRFFHNVSEKIYKQADSVLVTSRSFSGYFEKEFGITHTKYLPQYAESLFTAEECEKKPDDTIDLMFAGNIGIAQSVDTIVKAAKLTSDISNLRWHIVGDGSELDRVKKLCESEKITSVFFHGRKSVDEMPKYYAMADAMLVTMQKNEFLSMTLPGKVQSYMAAGKPIIGSIDGETAELIKEAECGFCVEAENAELLAEKVRAFINCDKSDMGHNAKKYYDDHFKKDKFIGVLEDELLNCIDR